jgi:type IX secretion system protein PorZ/two component regulator with propeller domain
MSFKWVTVISSMKKFFFLSLFLANVLSGYAQNLALGQWKVHLPYVKAKSIAIAGDRVYCASDQGLFFYSKSDASVTPMSKITGLSELSVSTTRYSADYKTLVVAYSNSNIDLIKGNTIINIPDIKRKNIIGDKTIYGISFRNKFAYLSCGFGIVVLDLVREEIKETYIIGPGGTQIKIFDVAFLNGQIYAATESGVFFANENDPNLPNFDVWSVSLDDGIATGDYNIIEEFNGELLVNYTESNGDDIKLLSGGVWIDPPGVLAGFTSKNYAFRNNIGQLLVVNNNSVSVFANDVGIRTDFYNGAHYSDPVMRDSEKDTDGTVWIADNNQGLVRIKTSGSLSFIFPDGPASELVSAMGSGDGKIWITHATRTQGWFNEFTKGSYSSYIQGDWKTFDENNTPNNIISIGNLRDMMSLAVDPDNADHVFIGSKLEGVLEIVDGIPVEWYRDHNSSLQVGIGFPDACQAVGMGFDADRNLWVLNSLAAKPVNVRKPDGQWKAYAIPGISGAPLMGDMTVDSYGQKWINVNGNNAPLGTGLVVFNDNGTLDDTTDDKAKFLSTGLGSGNLPSADIRAIEEDHDGEIWIGTGKGVAVVYSPTSVTSTPDFDVQQVLINQDGVNQYLLETEVVTAIAIDGANRKWFGTEAGGVFLMSADGTEQILNFNEDNSPLLSNLVLSITIDQQTGDIYFGTNKGIISYRGDAIEGEGGCGDVLVYPNPVREDYSGPIAIKGLVPNGNVKITDVSGNLIYETTANGSQAIWNGENFEGRKAQTGVYLIFSSDSDGTNTCITKLLFIN